jgi:iron complex outermembrane receptor protein
LACLSGRGPAWLLALLPALCAAPAQAQAVAGSEAAAALPADTGPVVITGTRVERRPFDVPASVDRVDGDALRNDRLGLNLTETLGLLPGITARDRQNWAQDVQISIRGFGARSTFGIRGVRVIVDGIPATLPDGQGQVSHIDLQSAERVEVLRGPFSALYGNSSGGVIQVFTPEGSGPPQFGFGIAVGSDRLRRETLQASGAEGTLGYVASLSHLSTDGPRDHSAAKRDNANLKLTWRPDDSQRFTLVANALDQPAQDPLGLTRAQFESDPRGVDPAALQFNTRKTVDQGQLGLQWERRFGAQHALQWTVYAGQRHTEQFQAIPTGPQASPLHPGGVIQLGRDYSGTDVRWTWRAPADDAWSLVAGLSYDTLGEQRRGFQNFIGPTLGVEGALRRDERNSATTLDPYLQGSLKLGERWRLDAGVRHSSVHIDSRDRFIRGPNGDDSGSADFSATSPALGLMFMATDTLHLYASYGRGFETPTLNELAYRSDGTAGLNFGLKPSRSNNLELGAKWRFAAGQLLQAAVFESRTSDELVTRTNSGGRASFQNATATRRRGVELGYGGQWGDWRAQAAATWLDAVYRDSFLQCAGSPCTTPTQLIPGGRRIPGIARGTAAVSLDWAPPAGWRAGLEARHSSGVPVNDAGTEAAPSYTVASAHAGYLVRISAVQLRGFVRVDNLFDRRYAGSVIVNESNGRYYEPAPGRSAYAGLDVSYAF